MTEEDGVNVRHEIRCPSFPTPRHSSAESERLERFSALTAVAQDRSLPCNGRMPDINLASTLLDLIQCVGYAF